MKKMSVMCNCACVGPSKSATSITIPTLHCASTPSKVERFSPLWKSTLWQTAHKRLYMRKECGVECTVYTLDAAFA